MVFLKIKTSYNPCFMLLVAKNLISDWNRNLWFLGVAILKSEESEQKRQDTFSTHTTYNDVTGRENQSRLKDEKNR